MGAEFAEAAEDFVGLEVDAFDLVVTATALDGGPFDDMVGRGTKRIAHVGLLENVLLTRQGFAVSDELFRREILALGTVNDFEQAKFDGVLNGDAVVEIPWAFASASLLDELIDPPS